MKNKATAGQYPKDKKPAIRKQEVKEKKSGVKDKELNGYWIYLGAILLLTCIVFFPILDNGFTNWDDPTYITNNPLIKELSAANIKRIFSEVYFANYQPLHILSYAIEYHFFKMNAFGYHGVSLIMHLINVLLVFFFIRKLSDNNTIALATCILFAVNPLHTESVAWVAERKDLLYSMFFFASLICYLNYIKGNNSYEKENKRLQPRHLIYSFLFFVLSVFSKAMAVSLVPVLFLLDFYVDRKFDVRSVVEKIPFVLLAVTMGLVSVNASKKEGSIDTSENFSFVDRLFFASHNLMQYIFKSLIPFNQSAYYQYPEKTGGLLPIQYYIAGIIAVALAVFTFYSLKKGKQFFFSVTFFVLTVFLVLMLIPVGPTIFSERYSYIPSVGFFFIMVFYIHHLEKTKPELNKLVIVIFWGVTCTYSYLTYQRCKVWKDSISLWNDAIMKFPNAPHALNNRGDAYFQAGQFEPAILDFNAAIKANSAYAQAYYNRGNAYGQLGKPKEAFADLNEAIRLDPKNADAYNKRGQANGVLGNFDAAINDFNTALKLKPSLTEVYFNLGITYLNANKRDLACQNLKIAVDAGFENALRPYNEMCGKQ